jgi:hypothetical protein
MTGYVTDLNREGEMKAKTKGRKTSHRSRNRGDLPASLPGQASADTHAQAAAAEVRYLTVQAPNAAGEAAVTQAQPFMGLPIYTMAEVDQLTKIARQQGIDDAKHGMRNVVHHDRIKQFIDIIESTPREFKRGSFSVTVETARALASELRSRGYDE